MNEQDTDWEAGCKALEREVHKWHVKYDHAQTALRETIQKKNNAIERQGEKYRRAQEELVEAINESILLKAKLRAATILLGEQMIAVTMDEMENEE